MSASFILCDTAIESLIGLYNYWIVIFLMMTGFYIVIARENLVKTIIGLNIFQTSVFLLYITMGKVHGGTAPILKDPAATGHGDTKHETVEHAFHPINDVESFNSFETAHTAPSSSEVLNELLDAVDAEPAVNHVATASFDQDVAHQVGEAAGHGSEVIYSNPLPSVLMLTAIVVGIATTALALALVVRIREDYGTIEEDEILEMDRNE